MCDLFTLIMASPSYTKIKGDKKMSQVCGWRACENIQVCSSIYKLAMVAHGLTTPNLVVLSKDVTKVKTYCLGSQMGNFDRIVWSKSKPCLSYLISNQ